MWKMGRTLSVTGPLAGATAPQQTGRHMECCRYRFNDNTCTWVVSLKFRPSYAFWNISQYPLLRSPCRNEACQNAVIKRKICFLWPNLTSIFLSFTLSLDIMTKLSEYSKCIITSVILHTQRKFIRVRKIFIVPFFSNLLLFPSS
jgi:hypothetical protein